MTLPKHLVIGPDGIDPTWARVADHILDIQRPDLLDTNSLRPGEADLHLVKKSCTNMSSTPSAAPPKAGRAAGHAISKQHSSTQYFRSAPATEAVQSRPASTVP